MKLYKAIGNLYDGREGVYIRAENFPDAMRVAEVELTKISGEPSRWYQVEMVHKNADAIPTATISCH